MASGGWRATLRRSSHRATGGNLELLRGVVVDGWFSVLSACRSKALQATPLIQSVKPNSPAVLLRRSVALQRQPAGHRNSSASGVLILRVLLSTLRP